MPVTVRQKLNIEERRRKVAALYLAHVTQEEIAKQVGVSQAQVSLDIKAIREQYKVERDALIDREVATLDNLERECAVRYQQDKEGEWIDRRLRVKERRARLLGLDQPKQVAVSNAGEPFKVYMFDPEKPPVDTNDSSSTESS